MKKKYFKKTLVFAVILLFTGMILSPAVVSQEVEKENRSHLIKLTGIKKDGTLMEKIFSLNDKEYDSLRNKLSQLLENLTSQNNGIQDLIEYITNSDFANDNPIISKILEIILNNSLSKNNNRLFNIPFKKTFLISQGWSYQINLLKDSKYRILTKPLMMWRYSEKSKAGFPSTTLVLRQNGVMNSEPAELLKGRQMGIMTSFTGVYIYKANTFPRQSYTFFIGFANFANGFAKEEFGINIPT